MSTTEPVYTETGIGLVGILNITPDSFSDGGEWVKPDNAIAQAITMADQGAAVIDVGAESTRPGAQAVSAEEEWKRLEPILNTIIPALHQHEHAVKVSVDTRHAATAEKALALGADWINDVSGLQDDAMVAVARDSDADWVVMHSLSVPVDPEVQLPPEADPITSVRNWAGMTLDRLMREGIAKQRIILDPGIGFGKSAEQSLTLIRNIQQLKTLGTRLMVGHSRKSFLSLFTEEQAAQRDTESSAISVWLMQQHVEFVRVHNVHLHARTLRVAKALQSRT